MTILWPTTAKPGLWQMGDPDRSWVKFQLFSIALARRYTPSGLKR